MDVRLLGPLEVADDSGARLDPGTRKQRAVLAMLALSPGRPVSLDRLVEELWAGEAPAKATATLQAYVSHLRRVLEPGRRPRTPPRLLLTREPGYLLDITPAQTDAGRFAAWAADGRRLLAAGRPAEAAGVLDRALGLWRGEPLAEFPGLGFAGAEAARLSELRSGVVEDRLAARLELGEASVPELEELVSAGPYRERAWSLLVLALYRAGRQAEALSALRRVRALLSDELGIEPGPALRRLEQAVLTQSPELEAPSATEAGPQPGAAAGVARHREGGRERLVGREREVRALEERLAEARGGRGGLVIVSGEAGIGKTSLARAAADVAGSRGFRVVWGRCPDEGGAPAFWPWRQAGVLPARPHAELFDLYDDVLAYLGEEPTLLVLEDLHWADASSLKLLEYVSAELPRTATLAIVTLRPDEQRERLGETLGALSREGLRLPLVPFGADEVRAYLRQRDVRADPVALLDRSGGNPFYLEELLRLPESERDRVPPGARDVIGRRLARLPGPTQDLLKAAAVAGREADVDLLSALAGRPVEDVMTTLEPALATGLITESATGYRFSHALVREALDTGLTRLDRARLHLRAAEHLERVSGADAGGRSAERAWGGDLGGRSAGPDPAVLAAHFAAAAPLAPAGKAVAYATEAARQAAGRHGYQEAVALWELALAHLPPGDSAARCRTLTGLGQARRAVGDAEGAFRDLAEAIAQAQRIGDRAALVPAVTAFGAPAVWNWRPYGFVDDDLADVLENLLAGPLGDHDRAALLGTLGVELHYGPRRAEGERRAAEAVELARATGDPALLARTLNNYLLAAFVPGRNHERLRAVDELLAIPCLRREERLVARAIRMSCLLRAGDLAEWEHELSRCEQLLRELRRPELEAMVRVAQTGGLMLRARWAEAESLLERFPAPRYGASLWGLDARRLIARYLCGRARGEAAGLVDELVAAAEPALMAPVRPVAILAALENGREALARELLARWGGTLREDWSADFLWPVWGLVAARLGTPSPGDLYARLLPIADQLVVMGSGSAVFGSVRDALAQLALRLGRTEEAAEHARAAIAAHQRLGLPYWEQHSHDQWQSAIERADLRS
ncbi:AfsR/SARP family transcriptional regulator [Nonomuraea harbinensis]|uniref:BTAD domain-containing putative transcriptional regulator n=1 Tax=Nonomuraea harbinensis TaxID=1286938 RepID=A0ABW1C0E4_9ACTN|nr:AfsR/SARP family transcriptional regulator [Nonomuraea harbinensis]